MNRRQAPKVPGKPLPGMADIVALLRAGPLPERSGDEWAVILRRAEQQGVLPVLAQRLRSLETEGSALPFRAERRLARAGRQSVLGMMGWVAMLRELLRAFAEAGVRAVPLKGPALAQRLYGAASLRTYRDLDIFIPRRDAERGDVVMAARGFERTVRDSHQQSPWARDGRLVELHFELEDPLVFDMRTEDIWSRSVAAMFEGVPCRELAASDELAFLCTHAARHHFDRLTLVVDLTLAFDLLGPAAAAEGRDWSHATLMPGVAALGYAMASRLKGDIAETPWPVSAVLVAKAGALAERMWDGMMAGEVATPDRTVVYGYLSELEPTWAKRQRRRLQLLRLLLTRTVSTDRDNAARAGLAGEGGALAARQVRLAGNALRRLARRVRG